MKIDVYIKNNETGEVRVYHDDFNWQDYEGGTALSRILYQYGEGNYSCDCNRELFFARSVGEEGDDVSCSETRFTITKITNRATGEVIAENL